MAFAPCSRCGQRYLGKAFSAYPALVNGTDELRDKIKLCPACSSNFVAWCDVNLTSAAGDEHQFSLVCQCGAEAAYTVFVTAYPPGSERVDWYGRLCSRHALPQAAEALGLS